MNQAATTLTRTARREGLAQELWAVVGAQNLRQRSLLADLFEDADQALRSD